LTDAPFVDRAHALGLKVLPWTINDADTMRSQIAAGVDGIITDYPVTLRTVMAELGMPLPPAFHR
jgi:glycerophosphoryl diester phosphodiesterase